MTIYDFVYLLSDDLQTAAVYDFAEEKEVFCGSARDASFDYGDLEIMSIDIDACDSRGGSRGAMIVFNIDTSEE